MARTKEVVEQEGLKFCPRCGVVKDKSEFSKQASRPDGLSPFCEPCRLEYEAEYRKKRKAKKEELFLQVLEGYFSRCMVCGHKGNSDSLKLHGPSVRNSVPFYRELIAKRFPETHGFVCLNCEAEGKLPD